MIFIILVKLHKRRIFSYITIFIIIGIFLALINPSKEVDKWFSLVIIGFIELLLFISIMVEWSKLKKLKSKKILKSDKSILDVSELVIKRDTTWFIQYWIYETDGKHIGTIRPITPWYAYPLGILGNSLFFLIPTTFIIEDVNSNSIGHFKTNGKFKTVLKSYYNNKKIGTYYQNNWKTFLEIKGELFDQNNQKILDVKVASSGGDFHLTNVNGRFWASFSYGNFALKYKEIFKDEINPLIRLNPNLTIQERILFLSIVAHLGAAQIKLAS